MMNRSNKLLYLCIIIFTLNSCGNAKQDGKETTTRSEINTSAVEVNNNGVYINHYQCGEGELTLLFVHGWCINQSYWANQFEALCDDYHLVSIDLPGFGQSGKNRDDWTMEAFGKDIGSVIEQLKLKKVVLVGHSMGGDVILEAALDREEVIALIGVDNFKDVGMEMDEETIAEINDFMSLLKADFSNIASAYAEGTLFHPSTDSTVVKRVINDFRIADSTIAIASLEALFEYASKEPVQLSKLKKKLYLINSDATPTYLPGLEATGVDFEVIDIPATGHYPMVEKPERFNQLLQETIKIITIKQNLK